MNKLDLLIEMRAELDALTKAREQMVEDWERRKDLLADVELLLRRVMEYPETWEIAPTVAQLLVRIREETGLDAAEAIE